MSAIEWLREYGKADPKRASFLYGAVACFAAVAVIAAFGLKLQASTPDVVYLLLVGLALVLITNMIDDQLTMLVIRRFVLIMLIILVFVFAASKIYPKSEAVFCLAFFWLPCEYSADKAAEVANTESQTTSLSVPSPAPPDIKTSDYKVFIQFAGFQRPTIQRLAQGLVDKKWNVQASDRGGERIGSAAGLAEVRYGPADDARAADALAASLQTTKITKRSFQSKQVAGINAKTLEVWIGQ